MISTLEPVWNSDLIFLQLIFNFPVGNSSLVLLALSPT